MRINHKYDIYGRTEPSIIYLAKPGKRLYCALDGVDTSTVSLSLKTNNTAELAFSVDKYIDNTITDGYEELDELMELYCDGIWFKIVDPPTINNDGLRETKDITAESYEIMLTQYKLKSFKINMGEEDSYEMMYQASHDTSKFYQIKFYDPENEGLSFLNLVLKHADVPGWKIGYVDNITPDDDGVLLPNNICNFEVDDQNVYAFLTQEAAQAYKCVFEFDTVNMTINVYRPDSLGKDTNVVLSFRNIQNSISISRDENLVTQFYVEGLDDYNIDAVNFGDSVITDLSYFVREPYMNAILQEKYNAWQDYRESRREEFMNLSREYNKNLEILTELTNRVPVDSAQTNWFGKTVEDLKDAYDSNMAIIKGFESLYVDDEKNFDLDALKKSSDWPMYESIMNYTLPAIVAALQAQDEVVEGFGKGNIISCVNPVVLGQDWYMVGSGTSTFKTIQVDDAPAYGITRGVQVTGTDGGIYQHNISTEPSQRYTLSCFVKGSGTFYLGYGNTGEDRKTVSFGLNSSWVRVYTSFNLSSRLIDVSFTGTSNFTVCGMQLEMGNSPSQFGYFTQSENIMKAYETDWKLYGISELKVKISTYDGCIKELKKSGYNNDYNPLSGYEEAYFTQMHQKYLDYLNLKEQAEDALTERQAEYDAAKKPEIQEKRNQIAKDVLLENFGKVQDKYPAFTDKEAYIIKSLYNQSTYTNENIIVTTLDSTADAVDKSKVLYDDALEELYVESHPQYTYTDDVENVYALPEFKEYHEQLAVNDFVRVGLTDANYIKLRVIEITYNPCDLDESMEITFSNMIQYKAKRNDYNALLNDALNTSNRNGGRVNSVNKSTTSDYVITADAIKQIFSNPLFNSMLGGATTGGTGSGGTITADMIVAELVKAKEGVFDRLTVDTAYMKYLDAKLISADTIATRVLNAEQANIEQLAATLIEANQISADMANIKNLVAGNAGIGELHAIHLTAENVEIDQAVITDLIAKKIAVGDLMAQNALANQIVLISKDNKPTIAFQESTQQFYDADGNVRVQIGMDGNRDFNFIVKNGDKAALFDENGITQTGIPDNTILGDMINNATITKDKLGFQIIEPNEQGGIDITNIYDGKGNQWWGIEKTTITDDYTKQIKNVTDTLTGQIETKVSNTDYLKDQEAIQTEFSDIKQDVSGITSTVSSMRTDLSEAQEKITANSSSIIQNADKILFMVTGTRESGFEITQDFIQMISDHISIKADSIDIDGIITAMNTHKDSGKTKIDGGVIDTNTVNAMLIAAQMLQSKNYNGPSVVDGIYAQAGLQINMETGAMTAKNFAIDDEGNAYFRGNGTFEGTITANEGHIGGTEGFVIKAGKLYSGMENFPEQPSSVSRDKNVYIGTDGIALGSGNFRVDSNGKLYANSGEFTGTIYADGGTIGGWHIYENSLSNTDGSISLSPDGLRLGSQLNIDGQGNASFGGKLIAATGTFKGELSAATGTFSGELKAASGTFSGNLQSAGGTFTGTLNGVDGNFSGTLSAATGSFTGSVTATSLTLRSGVTIDASKINGLSDVATSGSYNDLDDKPDIPTDLEYYIKKDGTVGAEPSEGATGFKVSYNGLLQASNAVIYGEIVASSGKIGGFNISTTSDASHYYTNTLYRITTDGSYYYQAGISSDGTSPKNATFYVRKSSNANNWDSSTTPYFVRNNGSLYAQDATVGTALYICENSTKYDSRLKIISYDKAADGNNQLTMGVLGGGTSRISFDRQAINFESFYGTELMSFACYDGTNAWFCKRDGCKTLDIGQKGNSFSTLYVNKIVFDDNTSMTTAGSDSDSGNKTTYQGSTYINVSGNKISAVIGATESELTGLATRNWVNKYYVPLAGNKASSPITGTLHMAQGKGWDMADSNGNEITGIYYDGSKVIIADKNKPSLLRGTTITIGQYTANSYSSTVKMPSVYYKDNLSNTKYVVMQSDGTLGVTASGGGGGGNTSLTGGLTINLNGNTSNVNSWTGTSNATINITPNSIGAATSGHTHDMSSYATQNWVKGAFGDTLSISNNKLTLKNYNGSALSSVTLPTNSGGSSSTNLLEYSSYSSQWTLATDSASTYLVFRPYNEGSYKSYLGDKTYRWQRLNSRSACDTSSDRTLKDRIVYFNNNESFDKFFMDLKPVSYHLKYENETEDHYGFIAQDVEQSFNLANINCNNLGIIRKNKLEKSNEAGLCIEYSLAYEEFIPINIMMTQKAHHRIDSLEEQNQQLKNIIISLQGEISIIKQKLEELSC